MKRPWSIEFGDRPGEPIWRLVCDEGAFYHFERRSKDKMGNDSWNPTDPNNTTDGHESQTIKLGHHGDGLSRPHPPPISTIAMRHCLCEIEWLREEIERLKGLPDD